MNYQKIVIVGNATKDAEAREAKSGTAYTRFAVAVGEAEGETSFFPVVVFGKAHEAVARYVTKGRQVLVEGRVTTGQGGRFRVVANRVVFGRQADQAE